MFLETLDESSLAYIVLSQWMPGLIAVIAGGVLANLIYPKLQRRSQRSAQVEEKKIEIAEALVTSFNRYIIAWNRLMVIAKLGEERALKESEQERKKGFVEDRKLCRDTLLDNLRLCQLYFSDETCAEMQRFMDWDDAQSSKLLKDLPPISAWRDHENTIVGLVKNEIN